MRHKLRKHKGGSGGGKGGAGAIKPYLLSYASPSGTSCRTPHPLLVSVGVSCPRPAAAAPRCPRRRAALGEGARGGSGGGEESVPVAGEAEVPLLASDDVVVGRVRGAGHGAGLVLLLDRLRVLLLDRLRVLRHLQHPLHRALLRHHRHAVVRVHLRRRLWRGPRRLLLPVLRLRRPSSALRALSPRGSLRLPHLLGDFAHKLRHLRRVLVHSPRPLPHQSAHLPRRNPPVAVAPRPLAAPHALVGAAARVLLGDAAADGGRHVLAAEHADMPRMQARARSQRARRHHRLLVHPSSAPELVLGLLGAHEMVYRVAVARQRRSQLALIRLRHRLLRPLLALRAHEPNLPVDHPYPRAANRRE
eukprot:186086-Rhodomonas_salina.1